MTWRALTSAFSAALRRLSCISNLGAFGLAQITGASGHVKPTFKTQRNAGALLSRRDELAAKIKKARLNHRARNSLYSEAQRITTSILAGQHGRG